jgi:methyltransferase family protein
MRLVSFREARQIPLLVRIYRARFLPVRPIARVTKTALRTALDSRPVNALIRSAAWPPNWAPSLRAARILVSDYGHLKSVSRKESVDSAGEPIPWYTYPAIEFIRGLDFGNKSVFEYGSGNSTLFWSRIAARVVSVEDDESWHARVAQRLESVATATVILEPDLNAFVSTIELVPGPFDVIVIDGPGRGHTRLKCCKAAIERLNEGGVIILDNADWLPESAAFLQRSGLLRVDMAGFTPINANTSTTSFFFDRHFNFPAKNARRPQHGVGSLPFDWETLPPVAGRSLVIRNETFAGVEFDQPFTITAQDTEYRFRLLVYHINETATAIAIIDQNAGLVVLDGHCIEKRQSHTRLSQMKWIEALSYDEFRQFVNSHPRRRYKL